MGGHGSSHHPYWREAPQKRKNYQLSPACTRHVQGDVYISRDIEAPHHPPGQGLPSLPCSFRFALTLLLSRNRRQKRRGQGRKENCGNRSILHHYLCVLKGVNADTTQKGNATRKWSCGINQMQQHQSHHHVP